MAWRVTSMYGLAGHKHVRPGGSRVCTAWRVTSMYGPTARPCLPAGLSQPRVFWRLFCAYGLAGHEHVWPGGSQACMAWRAFCSPTLLNGRPISTRPCADIATAALFTHDPLCRNALPPAPTAGTPHPIRMFVRPPAHPPARPPAQSPAYAHARIQAHPHARIQAHARSE